MTDTHTLAADSPIDRIFGPVAQRHTWVNMVYLLFSFPLALLYFVVVTVLFSAGVSLLVLYVGFFILAAGFFVTDVLAAVDRHLVNLFLRAGIPAPAPVRPATGNIFRRLRTMVDRRGAWKRLAYVYGQFVLGTVSFVLVMTLIPLSLILLTLPLTYGFISVTVVWPVETFDQAIYYCCFGAVFTLLSVHVLNGWAGVCRRFAQRMLA